MGDPFTLCVDSELDGFGFPTLLRFSLHVGIGVWWVSNLTLV